jgi:hypothetical protein
MANYQEYNEYRNIIIDIWFGFLFNFVEFTLFV